MNPTIEPGTLVDQKFEIISVLGRGGMGTVYRAMQRGLERMVALKFLQTDVIEDDESKKRFEREAQALSVLTHKNIAAFYTYGIWQDKIPYIAMELLEGRTLSKLLADEQRLGWSRSCAIITQVCDAMDYAHKAGIIHRDLKPGNIVLLNQNSKAGAVYEINSLPGDQESSDFVKVMDFGLSKVTAQSEIQRLTLTGALIGSVHYMSPEQCSGMAASSRSDIYSLACIFYECITGRAPHEADNPIGLIHKHANEAVIPPVRISKEFLPAGLDEVILKALEKNPEQRYQTMADFQADIAELSAGRGASLNVFVQGQHTRNNSNWFGKLPLPTALLGALLFGTLALAIFVFIVKPPSLMKGKINSKEITISMSSQSAERLMSQARVEFHRGYVSKAMPLLKRVLEAKTLTSIRIRALMDMAICHDSMKNYALENECLDEVISICTKKEKRDKRERKDGSISDQNLDEFLADALAAKASSYLRLHDLQHAEEVQNRYNKLSITLRDNPVRSEQNLFLNGTLAGEKGSGGAISFYTTYASKRSNDSLKMQALLLRLTHELSEQDRTKYESEYLDCVSKMDPSMDFATRKIGDWLGFTDYSRHLISKLEPILRKKNAWHLADECALIEQLGHNYVQNSVRLSREVLDKLRNEFISDLKAAPIIEDAQQYKPLKHLPVMILSRNINYYYGKTQAQQFMYIVLKTSDEKGLASPDTRHQVLIEGFSVAPGSLSRSDLDTVEAMSKDQAVPIDQRAAAMSIIGHYYRENNQYEEGLKYYRETVQIARTSPKGKMAEASALVWTGHIYDLKQDPRMADKFYWDAFIVKCQIDPTYAPLARTSRNEVLHVMELAKHEAEHAE